MMKKGITRIFIVIAGLSFLMAFFPEKQWPKKPIYLNTSYTFKERAADLVSRMTTEEKMSQLGNTMPAIPRLGVNKYAWSGPWFSRVTAR